MVLVSVPSKRSDRMNMGAFIRDGNADKEKYRVNLPALGLKPTFPTLTLPKVILNAMAITHRERLRAHGTPAEA